MSGGSTSGSKDESDVTLTNKQGEYKKSFIKLRNIICKMLTDIRSKAGSEEIEVELQKIRDQLKNNQDDEKKLEDILKKLAILDDRTRSSEINIGRLHDDVESMDRSISVNTENIQLINNKFDALKGFTPDKLDELEETGKQLDEMNKKLETYEQAQYFGGFVEEFTQMVNHIWEHPGCNEARDKESGNIMFGDDRKFNTTWRSSEDSVKSSGISYADVARRGSEDEYDE